MLAVFKAALLPVLQTALESLAVALIGLLFAKVNR